MPTKPRKTATEPAPTPSPAYRPTRPQPLRWVFWGFIGIAAFNFLLDFDMADHMIRTGALSKMAWYVAFGLMVTLVWLYLEMLRLLSYLNSD